MRPGLGVGEVGEDGMGNTSGGRVDTVVLVHGLWMTPRSWEGWAERYAARGFRVLAPAWPGFDREVTALRADPGHGRRHHPASGDRPLRRGASASCPAPRS